MVHHKNNGFTIIEALVSILILTVILLGLLSGLIITYKVSTKNLIRDEAVKIAQEYADKYRNTDFNSIPANKDEDIYRQVRNFKIHFKVNVSSKEISGGLLKKITIKVTWNYKGKNYSYEIKTLVSKNE